MNLIAEIGSACDGGLELTLATIAALEKAGVDAFWYPRIWEGMAKMIRRVAEEATDG